MYPSLCYPKSSNNEDQEKEHVRYYVLTFRLIQLGVLLTKVKV